MKVLLVVGGGIAAYKVLELTRRLREREHSVQAVLTEASKEFITPMSIAALSGAEARSELFSLTDEAKMGHIEFSRAADLVVVAPATADLLARMAHGLANDLATTTLLATDKRVLVAPAMNVRMWLHPATQRNVATLRQDGVLFVGPDDGEMACGEFGPGRMAEPHAIIAAIEEAYATQSSALKGRRVVVTSGPTLEPIDPVRFLGNRSSGKQGHAIAAAASEAGAEVTLVSGPVSLPSPPAARVVRVETAQEMLAAVENALPADIFISAAAVADWRVATPKGEKLKKGAQGPPTLSLVENPDILRTISRRAVNRPKLCVGFAAETTEILAHAQEKLASKGCDLIVANSVGEGSSTFGGDDNEVIIITKTGVENWPRMSKQEVARKLIAVCSRLSDGAS